MAIKTKVKKADKKKKKKNYPYLGIFPSGKVILFTEYKTGVVLKSEGDDVGWYSVGWREENITPFTGKLILSNE